MDKKIYSSAELNEQLNEVRNLAKQSIVGIMRKHNVKSADFLLDEDGRNYDDDEYDDDFVYDNRVWTECYGKYNNETGYISLVEIDDADNIKITAEGEDGTYPTDYVCHSTGVYVDILEHIQFMENKGILK